MTIYIPALTPGTLANVQVMATSGSDWVDLYDELGVQVSISASLARNINKAGCYGYRFYTDGTDEEADRTVTVIGAYQVSLRGLA